MCAFNPISILKLDIESIGMDLKKSLTWIMLSFLTIGTGVYTKDTCADVITKKTIDGYYCPVDTKTVQISHVSRHLCTHYCVTVLQCPVFSYYETKGMCMLQREICLEMVQGTGQVFSSIIVYGSTKQECITWLPYPGSVPDQERLVVMANGNQVVRFRHNNEILPGKATASKVKTVSFVNVPTKIDANLNPSVEYLVVSDTCSITWVPYVAGNPMPSRAVVGGQKVNGKPLFVAALWVTMNDMKKKYLYGCFDPESNLGYAAAGSETESNSTVDIMVENWDINEIL